MPLNEANVALLTQLAESGAKPIHEGTPGEARALSAALLEMYPSGPEMARVEDHTVPTADGTGFAVRVLVADESPRAVIIYYHGGGWVLGNIAEHDTLGRELAERSRCAVVLVDYRLAPEHRYPVAADDAYAALEWTAAHVGDIAGADVPLIVAGDSAGGNLATVTARRSRDRGGPAIALQALVYPATDAANFDRPSQLAEENQLLLSRDGMMWFYDHYVPDPDRRAEPDVSPLRAEDLSGLPPAVVILAQYDVLRDEIDEYVARLREAGVPVDVHVHEGQMHAFFTILLVPGHEQAVEQIARAIDANLAAQPT